MGGRYMGVMESEPVLDAITVKGNVRLGDAAADLVGFHNSTGADQAAAVTCVSTSVAISVCGVYAFTSVQANALIANHNAMVDLLKEKGLMALT